MYKYSSGTSMAAPHVTGAAALLMSAYPNATPAQIKSALLEGANKDKNPIVYPFTGLVKDNVVQLMQEFRFMENFSPESRDEMIAQFTTEWEKVLAPYRQLEGAGRVSRTGLLDVKVAYDILGAKVNSGGGGSSSSGGCVAGIPAVIMLLAGALAFRRMKSRP